MMRLARLATAAVLGALLLWLTACGDSDYKRAARAADGVAQGLATVLNATKELHAANLLDKDEAYGLVRLNRDANLANQVFIQKARALKQIDPQNKALLAAWFAEAARALSELNDQGVLQVKNEKAKARLQVAFASIQAAVEILATVLQPSGGG